METSKNIEMEEGKTRILVPEESLKLVVPPKEPAFFNPKARLNRDFSVLAYAAFLKNFEGPKVFLEGLAGVGVRGLRVANEIDGVEKVIVNDLNPTALDLASKSALLNNIQNFQISENEVCRFFSLYSRKGSRGTIVDVDPFGSPAKYIDCAIRATMHGGLFSCTATDLQVLHGLFGNACKRRYGGHPLKTKYSNEIALRLIIGSIRIVAARLDVEIIPQFVESDLHYYRAYLKVLNHPDQTENLGFIFHCFECGNRGVDLEKQTKCSNCNSELKNAGPLWIGKIFQKRFVGDMLSEIQNFHVDKSCEKTLQKCLAESEMPPTYYTLDEVASKLKQSPPKLDLILKKINDSGFLSSPTSLEPTGFRTNTSISEIKRLFGNYPK